MLVMTAVRTRRGRERVCVCVFSQRNVKTKIFVSALRIALYLNTKTAVGVKSSLG